MTRFSILCMILLASILPTLSETKQDPWVGEYRYEELSGHTIPANRNRVVKIRKTGKDYKVEGFEAYSFRSNGANKLEDYKLDGKVSRRAPLLGTLERDSLSGTIVVLFCHEHFKLVPVK